MTQQPCTLQGCLYKTPELFETGHPSGLDAPGKHAPASNNHYSAIRDHDRKNRTSEGHVTWANGPPTSPLLT
ncbi:hypothetical protein Hamer_G019235 [Homarus americanus]|uniref:Uncharacterized protein n=1 Tax=Homarus americanus TaxID=6706 RepID=A0A8J5JMI3_HOMAM|nr:hypothetical protein Hamer_G019235 [Homarus americanus]